MMLEEKTYKIFLKGLKRFMTVKAQTIIATEQGVRFEDSNNNLIGFFPINELSAVVEDERLLDLIDCKSLVQKEDKILEDYHL
ncbi:MAG: hypothetical protein IAE91_12260 [Ignavibacteriaceae bacterium]|nr:hypothetical protein [Ignavibacteriaceae bacterium]